MGRSSNGTEHVVGGRVPGRVFPQHEIEKGVGKCKKPESWLGQEIDSVGF